MIPHPLDPTNPPPSIVRQGKNLSLLRQGFPLPADRCYKCNAPTEIVKRKNLVWHHPALYFTLLGGIFIYVILVLILRKRAAVEFGICPACNNRRTLWLCIWTSAILGSIPLFVYSVNVMEGLWAILGAVILIAGAVGATVCAPIGIPKYIDDYRIVLGGSGESYRNTFPEG